MKRKDKLAIAAACCLTVGTVIAAPGGGRGSGSSMGHAGSMPGNSGFGHSQASSQGNPSTGSANSSYGQSTSQAARAKHADDSVAETDDSGSSNGRAKGKNKAKRVHSKKLRTSSPGNSAFGHRQGDAS